MQRLMLTSCLRRCHQLRDLAVFPLPSYGSVCVSHRIRTVMSQLSDTVLSLTISPPPLFSSINLFEKHNNGVANSSLRCFFINQLQLGSGAVASSGRVFIHACETTSDEKTPFSCCWSRRWTGDDAEITGILITSLKHLSCCSLL